MHSFVNSSRQQHGNSLTHPLLSEQYWAKLVFGMNQSPDSYVDHMAFGPDPTLFRHFIVARDRVIRTVAGLRPFRPSGFVVRAEKMSEKLVIHNYGHGGAGITLSWGTSLLAVDLAPRSEARDCAVIGCGVVGLSTARLLQLRGYRTVIYTRDMPPATTSNVAGGLWEPVSLYDPDRVTPEFRRQYGTAARMAHQRYQSLVGQRYGVRWLPLYRLSETAIQPPPPRPTIRRATSNRCIPRPGNWEPGRIPSPRPTCRSATAC
jgi:FAD dependent oxidoreductase